MSTSRPGDIFQPGDLLNNTYRIETILGRGGTSEVYRARSEISSRVVALKALRAEFSMNDDYLALMTREEDIREIRHDVIVRYYDTQRMPDGHVYLVMDYVEGPGLDEKMRTGGMSAEDLLVVASRVAEGLVAAHSKNIVHRDLSPDNIILRDGKPEEAVIIDFGIAKDSNPGAETIVGNEFAGKYAYAAPEQLSGNTDARSDIYALGALLLATFRGAAPDIGSNPMQVLQKKAEVLDTEGVPEPLKSLIDKMTHPDPAERLQSAAALLAEINPEFEKTVIAPRPLTVPPATAAGKSASKKKSGGSKVLVPILALVILAAIGAGGYFAGVWQGLLVPSYPAADPFALVVERRSDGTALAVGYMPSEEALSGLDQRMSSLGGSTDLTLASGAISDTWGPDINALFDVIAPLDEWRMVVDGNRVRVTGLTMDRQLRESIAESLAGVGMPAAFEGSANIELGPRVLTIDVLAPILERYADCGPLQLVDVPAIGYLNGSTVSVAGRLAKTGSRGALLDGLAAAVGDRDLAIDVEILNPTLCLIDAALPRAPSGGFDIAFGFGDRPDPNPTGRYFVGENPVIDVVIPERITSGFVWVSVLDVSGNVFHLLPNLNRPDNSVAALRAGTTGARSIRVAFSLAEAVDSTRPAFLVDDSTLGQSKVIAIYADGPVFDGLRPTTESAEGYASALKQRAAPIRSLDSRILTTAKP